MQSTALNATTTPGTSSPPVAIGGVGGSGTRLIAQCLQELGYFMGSDLNESNDNLLFTLLFKRIEVLSATDGQFRDLLDIFFLGMSGEGDLTQAQLDLVNTLTLKQRDKHPVSWLRERAQALRDMGGVERNNELLPNGCWGWKEPSTHVILDRLLQNIPNMKYIHVVRNGLDMAYSENQTQLALWGGRFLGESLELSPKSSLKYWCSVHERVLDIGAAMGENFLFLSYDDFCTHPEAGIEKLCEFLAVKQTRSIGTQLRGLIDAPKSIGRYKRRPLSVFDELDIRYVETLGFDTST